MKKDTNNFNNLICFSHIFSYFFIKLNGVLFLSGK